MVSGWQALAAFIATKRRARDYRVIWEEWCQFLGGTYADVELQVLQATSTHANLYKDHISKLPGKTFGDDCSDAQKKLSGSTIGKKLYILRKLYQVLQAEGLCSRNPFVSVQIPSGEFNRKRENKMIPFEKVQELFDTCDTTTHKGTRDLAILSLMLGGGLRRKEVVNATLNDIKVNENGTPYIFLQATKAQRSAKQALPDWAYKNIKNCIADRKAGGAKPHHRLIVTYVGKEPKHMAKIDEKTITRILKRKIKDIGLDPAEYSPHSLRVTFGSKLDAAGLPIQDIQAALRHSSPSVTIRYMRAKNSVEDSAGRSVKY